MRNLEDCKAEIFRRSEERIKERKRTRKRVLACGIPLCLLLVAGGLYLRPLFEPVDHMGETNAGPTSVPERVLGGLNIELYSYAVEYVSVTLMQETDGTAVSKKLTDTEALVDLYGCMAKYFNLSGADVNGGMDGADGAIDELTGATGKEADANGTDGDTIENEFKYALEEKPADYTIVFREATGEETEFRLYENYLYNDITGCVVTLSDAKLSELKTKLEQLVTQKD